MNNKIDPIEITTKTDYWYYVSIVIITITIIALPLLLFPDYFISLFTK